jgi:hypothetical protein
MVTRDEKNSTAAFDLKSHGPNVSTQTMPELLYRYGPRRVRNIDASSWPCGGGISVSGIATMNERVVYFWRQTAHTDVRANRVL